MPKFLTILLITSVFSSFFGQVYYSPSQIPNPKDNSDGFISDPEDYLSTEEEVALNQMIEEIRKQKGFEIALVVVRSIDEKAALPFATELGELWGVGIQNTGIVILAAIQDRELAFATGYETEKYLPDLITQEIQQEEIIPYFKIEKYGTGLINGVTVIKQILLNETVPKYVQDAQIHHKKQRIWSIIGIITGALIILLSIIVSPKLRTLLINLVILCSSGIIAYVAYLLFLKETLTIDIVTKISIILGFIGVTINAYLVLKNESKKIWPYGLLTLLAVCTPLSGLYLYGYEVIVYVYLAGAGLTFSIFLIAYVITWFQKDPYRKYRTIQVFKLDFFSYLFPLPMFVVDMIVERQLDLWRNRVRFSKKTGLEMRKLSERMDDKYLQSGQVKEEQIKSVDYDVWITDEPDDILILKYTTWFSKYSTCSKCHYKTWSLIYDKTIIAASYSSSGRGERKKACAHCGHQSISTYTIPRLQHTSTSSSSSGGGWSGGSSGGGGGSWGGGSFGGGGSSSKW